MGGPTDKEAQMAWVGQDTDFCQTITTALTIFLLRVRSSVRAYYAVNMRIYLPPGLRVRIDKIFIYGRPPTRAPRMAIWSYYMPNGPREHKLS